MAKASPLVVHLQNRHDYTIRLAQYSVCRSQSRPATSVPSSPVQSRSVSFSLAQSRAGVSHQHAVMVPSGKTSRSPGHACADSTSSTVLNCRNVLACSHLSAYMHDRACTHCATGTLHARRQAPYLADQQRLGLHRRLPHVEEGGQAGGRSALVRQAGGWSRQCRLETRECYVDPRLPRKTGDWRLKTEKQGKDPSKSRSSCRMGKSSRQPPGSPGKRAYVQALVAHDAGGGDHGCVLEDPESSHRP